MSSRLNAEEQRAVNAIVEAVVAWREEGAKPRLTHGWRLADTQTANQAFRGGDAANRGITILLHNNPRVIQEANDRVGAGFIPGTEPSKFLYVRTRD